MHFYFSRPGKYGALVTVRENKEFEDNSLTAKSNAQSFIGDYKFDILINPHQNAYWGTNVFEMSETESNNYI